jgi:hypothetical protein
METVRRPYSIRIFLAEGSPSGLKTVEKSNWTGHGFVCPRPRFNDVKRRSEFSRPAVYLLLGPSDTRDIPMAYVGEADPIGPRLENHHANKEFWTVAYFFTSKDVALNKAHIEYLESRLIALAKEAKRCKLENVNNSALPTLSEAEIADVEGYLEEMLLCFPVLGVTVFEKPTVTIPAHRLLFLRNKGVNAEGYESEDGFVVRRGSTATVLAVPSTPSYVVSLRKQLVESGILLPKDSDYYYLTQDYEFTSPSTAAAFVVGANISGRESWKNSAAESLKVLQERSGEPE